MPATTKSPDSQNASLWRASRSQPDVGPAVVAELLPARRAAQEALEEGAGTTRLAYQPRLGLIGAVAAVDERVQAQAGRGLRLQVEPVLLRVRHVRRGGPRRLRLVVRRADVPVVAVEEPAAEVGVARDLPVARSRRTGSSRTSGRPRRPPPCPCRGRRSSATSSTGGCRPRSVLRLSSADAVDLRVDEHLLLGRGRHAGDDRGDAGRVGKALVDGHVSRDAEAEPARRAVGEHRRGGDHPLLVVLGTRRGRRGLVAQLAQQVEEVLRRLARRVPCVAGLLRGAARGARSRRQLLCGDASPEAEHPEQDDRGRLHVDLHLASRAQAPARSARGATPPLRRPPSPCPCGPRASRAAWSFSFWSA